MKKHHGWIIGAVAACAMILFSCNVMDVSGPNQGPAATAAKASTAALGGKRIVGYLPDWQGDPASVQYDKLTHLCYAFLQAYSDGSLDYSACNTSRLQQTVSLAHGRGVKVLISLGGWSNGAALSAAMNNSTARSRLASSVLAFIEQYQLDGFDFDWEGPANSAEGQAWSSFMQTISASLRPKGKETTSAIAMWYGDNIPSSALAYMDFANLMAYDNDGIYHSTYDYGVQNVDYWVGRGVSRDRCVLGVPFYGYADAGHGNSASYADILARDANAWNTDYSNGYGYNGIPTIKRKSQYVKDTGAGGIMIWELSQDVNNSRSLLSAIYEVLAGSPVETFTISASASANGSISPAGTVSVAKGASQSFSISPATGYVIDKVVVNGSSVGAVSSYTFNNVQANGSISASFKLGEGGGTCDLPTWSASAVYNSSAEVHWNNADWRAGWWTQGQEPGTTGEWGVWRKIEDCGGTTPVKFTITASAGANGQISPAGASQVEKGKSIAYTITAANGYQVENVVVNGSSVGAVSTYTFSNVQANATISATFAPVINPVYYQVTASAGANGSISPAGVSTVLKGSSVRFTFAAQTGYAVDVVSVAGAPVSLASDGSYTISNVQANTSISVSFKAVDSTIPAWSGNSVAYKLGDKVTYGGSTWLCKYAHSSNSAWIPGTPGLWFWEKI